MILYWVRLLLLGCVVALASGCANSTSSSPRIGGASASSTSAPLGATWAPIAAAAATAAGGCSSARSLPPQTMSVNGGILELPACGSFAGHLAYPSFSAAGTISATVQLSERSIVPSGPAHAVNASAFLYIGLVLTSSSAADSSLTFGSLAAGAPASCGQLAGTFADGTAYYAEGEFPVPGALERQAYRNTAGSGTWQGAGCVLDNETLAIGPGQTNVIMLTTSDQFQE